MAFDGTEGGQISLQDAGLLTKNHRTTNPNDRKGHFMGKDILNAILSQAGCMGIRVYHGLDSAGNRELIFVGADANGNDMASGIIADMSHPCPTECPPNSTALDS